VVGDATEIIVVRQHRQLIANAQLGQKGIDRSDLHSVPAAPVPQLSRLDVIVSIWHQQWHSRKPVENLISGLWSGESL
jgi:hypothetical protein